MSREFTSSVRSHPGQSDAAIRAALGLAAGATAAVFLGTAALVAAFARECERERARFRSTMRGRPGSLLSAAPGLFAPAFSLRGNSSVGSLSSRSARDALFDRCKEGLRNPSQLGESLAQFPLLRDAVRAENGSILDSRRPVDPEKLLGVLQNVIPRIARAEAGVLRQSGQKALWRMGYRTDSVTLPDEAHVAVRGTNDQGTSIFIEFDAYSGQVAADFSGFDGTSCEGASNQLRQELAAEGIRLDGLRERHHGKQAGGNLAGRLRALWNRGRETVTPPGVRNDLQQGE